MNQGDLDLALKKQRLQLRSALLRRQMSAHAAGIAPIGTAADRVQAAVAWLRAHPLLPIAAAVALIVARPRRALRWGRRAFSLWLMGKRTIAWLSAAVARDDRGAAAKH
jgi:hypothetical protein